MCGSPTAFADLDTESMLKSAAEESGNGVYVPNGALWGGEDIRRMADGGSLKARKFFSFTKKWVLILSAKSNYLEIQGFDCHNEETSIQLQTQWIFGRG